MRSCILEQLNRLAGLCGGTSTCVLALSCTHAEGTPQEMCLLQSGLVYLEVA